MTPAAYVFARISRPLTPRPRRNVWQWADEFRFLAKGVSAKSRHGDTRYSSADAPHQRGVMEAFLDPVVQTTVMIGASQVFGKALALDTPILSVDGWTTMGDLKFGDTIFSSDGRQCKVTFKTEVMLGRDCFRIKIHDSEFVADKDHLWVVTVQARARRDKRVTEEWVEILSTGALRERMVAGFETFVILNADPIHRLEQELPIAPYTFGLWLGDGHSYSASITVSEADRELLEHVKADGYQIREYRDKRFPNVFQAFFRKYEGCCARGHPSDKFKNKFGGCNECNRLRNYVKKGREMPPKRVDVYGHLKSLGVLGGKRIPRLYLDGSIEQRSELLRGLMDSDGYVAGNGHCELCFVNEELTRDAFELISSLGIRATFRTGKATIKRRFECERYRITFRTKESVFKLKRKLARLPKSTNRQTENQQIISIEPVDSVPVACIQVDSKDHTYLIGKSFTPTHNTEILNNLVGYCMDYRPTNMILMGPTIDWVEKWSKKKLMSMIRATPCLDTLLPSSRTRDSGNTILVKEYSGGSIFMVGANSPASLRGASGDILMADEIDTYEDSAGVEGDPLSLLFKRGESFGGSVVQVLSSTPTIEGSSKIWNWFEQSDQRFWYVTCPHCGVRGIFKWSQESAIKAGPAFFIDWPKGKSREAAMVCASCAKSLTDEQRLHAYYTGEWKATAPFSGIRGFHMNGLYCQWPAKSGYLHRLHQMVEEWERAKDSAEKLKVIINTGLCECWKLKTEAAPDWEALFNRRETYAAELPEPVVYLTASVDTQSDRLEYEIQGWGIGEECFGIETGKFFGNPHLAAVWGQLDELLGKTWKRPDGVALRINCTLIDSGGQTDNKAFAKPVYQFVRKRQGRYIFAIKGSSELGAPMIVGRLQKNGIMLQLIGTDVCKSIIYERLTIATPGAGYCHFPEGRGYDEEYFKQLTAEAVTLDRGKRKWVKMRTRNEALDLRVYAHAAFEVRNVNLESVARSIQPKTEQPVKPPSAPPITSIPGMIIKPAVVPTAKPRQPVRMRRVMKW